MTPKDAGENVWTWAPEKEGEEESKENFCQGETCFVLRLPKVRLTEREGEEDSRVEGKAEE